MIVNTKGFSFRFPKSSRFRVCIGFLLPCITVFILSCVIINRPYEPSVATQNNRFFNRECRQEEDGSCLPVPFPSLDLRGKAHSLHKNTGVNQLSHIDLKCLADGRLNKINHWDFKFQNSSLIKSRKGFKTILVMVGNYGHKPLGFGMGHRPFEAACCKEKRCFMTDNRSLLPVEDYDAIIFHYRTLLPLDLPRKRLSSQRYILFDLEPSAYLYQNPKIYDGVFNWTMNFRKDADIPIPYGRSISNLVVDKNPVFRKIESFRKEVKSVSVAWFASRCTSMSWREQFVESLQQFIAVDVYGSCGTLECSLDDKDQCYKMIEKNYNFYLSFENSLCQDYVTEKLFNILRYNIVPIVFGGADYSSDAPPHSYINVFDFRDTKSLAEYLLYLNRNITAYNEYFRWKLNYQIPTNWVNNALNFCYLCHKLHEDKNYKSYDDLSKYLEVDANCQRVQPVSWFEQIVSSRK